MEIVTKDHGRVSVTVSKENWSINNAFQILTIVYDSSSNMSYISSENVPAGVNINNRHYWTPIGNGKFVDNAIININYLDEESSQLVTYTLEEAITRIDEADKRLGVILAFYGNESNDTHTPGWCLYQFNSADLNDWDNLNAWTSIYYNRHKFIGWLRYESDLVEGYPKPHKGDYAYVGMSINTSVIYRCYDAGVWTNTQEVIQGNLSIVISGDITISDGGTWIVNGEDTGIQAKGNNGITPIFRATPTHIQVSYDRGISYENLVGYNSLRSNITFGTVVQLPSGSQPTVTNIGTDKDPKLIFGIPAAVVESELDTALVVQSEGSSIINVMSQKAVTDALAGKASGDLYRPSTYDFAIQDETNHVILGLANGHIKTKNFDSEQINVDIYKDSIYDFAIQDENDNTILAIVDGRIITKSFDSDNINYNSKKPYSPMNIVFDVDVNVNMLKNSSDVGTVEDSYIGTYKDKGILLLPESYTKDGKPTRLCIFFHGAGGGVSDNDSQIANMTLTKYLCANGFAVMDMNGMPTDWVETWYDDCPAPAAKEYVKVNNLGSPLAMECYTKGYKWVVDNYNIYTDGVFVLGASMGGLSSSNFVLNGRIPVLAQALLAPVLDTYNQAFLHPWTPIASPVISKYTLAKLYNFSTLNDEYVYDEDKLKGYNPIVAGMQSYSSVGRVISEGIFDYSTKKLNNETVTEYKDYPCPLKIWHCDNDNVVNQSVSERQINAIRRAGGKAWLRKLPSGGHAPESAGTVVDSPYGNTIFRDISVGSIYPAIEEIFLFLLRFNNNQTGEE